MTDKDILISDLNDISEILNNNGYGRWCATIRKAVALLKEQEARIEKLNRFVDGFSREAVPVVRCKDCKNGGMDSTSYPHYWCTRHTKYVRENYFCADGERR